MTRTPRMSPMDSSASVDPGAMSCVPAQADAIREAADWYARLAAGNSGEEKRREWEAWRDSTPERTAAWRRVERVRQQLAIVPPNLAVPALSARSSASSRRGVLRAAAMVGATGSIAWFALQSGEAKRLMAGYRTGTGERRSYTLADGSSLSLNTHSSVDVQFSDSRRSLRLRGGEILVRTGLDADRAMHRPFVVDTPQGSVVALGTRFTVRTDEGRTTVSVLEKAVRVQPIDSSESLLLTADQQVTFSSNAVGRAQPADIGAGAWQSGSIIAIDMSLCELVAELSRYRPGRLTCAPEVSHLKVSGAFPIGDTDRSLSALTSVFPVRVEALTRYWVTIVPR